jgi:hypothetical protein
MAKAKTEPEDLNDLNQRIAKEGAAATTAEARQAAADTSQPAPPDK